MLCGTTLAAGSPVARKEKKLSVCLPPGCQVGGPPGRDRDAALYVYVLVPLRALDVLLRIFMLYASSLSGLEVGTSPGPYKEPGSVDLCETCTMGTYTQCTFRRVLALSLLY